LQPAQPDQSVAHVPKGARFKFKPDEEKHHHDAELCEMLQVLGFGPHQSGHRPDHDARCQIAQDRPQTHARRKWHGDDGGAEVNCGLEQEAFHQGLSWGSRSGFYALMIGVAERVSAGV